MSGPHPSHKTRFSDASTYDTICVNCGATDQVPGGWGQLTEPCPVKVAQPTPPVAAEPWTGLDENGCYTLANGECVGCPHCPHSPYPYTKALVRIAELEQSLRATNKAVQRQAGVEQLMLHGYVGYRNERDQARAAVRKLREALSLMLAAPHGLSTQEAIRLTEEAHAAGHAAIAATASFDAPEGT